METFANLWTILLAQRAWSWTIMGIVFLLVFLLVRHFFMQSLIKRAQSLNSKWYHEIQKVYMKKCIAGWIFFLVSLLLFIFFWQTADLNRPSLYEIAVIYVLILTVLLSIMFHLIAFGVSIIHVLKQIENNQMTL